MVMGIMVMGIMLATMGIIPAITDITLAIMGTTTITATGIVAGTALRISIRHGSRTARIRCTALIRMGMLRFIRRRVCLSAGGTLVSASAVFKRTDPGWPSKLQEDSAG